ncbi:helix-turn-helix domain-containing protein [Micromonospora sp. NBC_01796]|uniref:helix-turn-helix domain-containing protein n=1 Tax=Micromonospora sp. NBC_01796 TaxID=2975987 RepID=UPI002DD891DD|nr:helix-turn-helix transcriptional regulator [Micromonospora sp. NBC_01796]WSA87074.1 helix-turn-helix domain-containing protein [Micromonospora sp. NBC_01796]
MPATIGDELFIGEQVAYWRKRRGKTQRALAGLAGMSQPYLSHIERGLRPVDRRATLVALAGALGVSVAELTGQPGDPLGPARAQTAASVPMIREALIMREVGELRPPVGSVAELMAAGGAYDFATAAPMLPSLLGGLTGPDLIQVSHVAVFTLKHLGYPDLGRDAARLAVLEAQNLGDPAWIGAAEFIRILSMPPELPRVPEQRAQLTADAIQPQIGNPEVRQAYGMLHLYASLRAAVDRKAADAMDHLREAQDVADSLGEPDELGLARFAFGPTNVDIWRLAVLLELGETGPAIEHAASVTPERIPLAIRQAPFYLDLTQALASRRRDDEAVAMFLRAEAIAPQYVRLSPTVRDTIAVITRRTRKNAISKPLRRAAVAVGLGDQLVR